MASVIGVAQWQWNGARPFDEAGWIVQCPDGHPARHLRVLEEQGVAICPHSQAHGGSPPVIYFQSDSASNEVLAVHITAAEASHIASNQLGKAAALAYLGVSWP